MTYYAYVTQDGEGCDYTIGCGKTLITIEADSFESATIKLTEIISERFTGETSLSDCLLIESKESRTVNVDMIYDDIKKEKERIKKEKQNKKDYEKYMELKKKFENG